MQAPHPPSGRAPHSPLHGAACPFPASPQAARRARRLDLGLPLLLHRLLGPGSSSGSASHSQDRSTWAATASSSFFFNRRPPSRPLTSRRWRARAPRPRRARAAALGACAERSGRAKSGVGEVGAGLLVTWLRRAE